MASREISVFTGILTQTASDTTTKKTFKSRIGEKTGIQLYKVVLSFHGWALSGTYGQMSVTMSAFAVNKSEDIAVMEYQSRVYPSTTIVDSSIAYQGFGANAGGVLSQQIDWTAPPGYIIGKDLIGVSLESLSTGIDNSMTYALYYKKVALTDLQIVQLSLTA